MKSTFTYGCSKFLMVAVAAVLVATFVPAVADAAPTSDPGAPGAVTQTLTAGTTVGAYAGYNYSIPTCALTTSANVDCWGAGETGDGNPQGSNAPIEVEGVGGVGYLSNIISLYRGQSYECALDSDGNVYCWGFSGYFNQQATPVELGGSAGYSGLSEADSVAGEVPCAAVANGDVDCSGKLVTTDGVTPLGDVEGVVGDQQITCGLVDGGTVSCWGQDATALSPTGTPSTNSFTLATPMAAPGGTANITDVDSLSGSWGFCGVITGGTVDCTTGFGPSSSGPMAQVQNDAGTGPLNSVTAVAMGGNDACAVTTTATAECWGLNDLYGQLGDGEPASNNTVVPSVVVGVGGTGDLTGVTAVALSPSVGCALLVTSGVDCWGDGTGGELGTGSSSSAIALDPEQVAGVGGSGLLNDVAQPGPEAVANVENGVTLTWSAPPNDGGSPITGYTVTANPACDACTGLSTTGSTQTVVEGLTPGVSYTFTVTASNDDDASSGAASAPSNSVTTVSSVVPGAPTDVAQTNQGSTVQLTWDPPTSDGGSPITQYDVLQANAGVTVVTSTGASSYVDDVTGLDLGQTYSFSVEAVNANGVSLPASVTTAVLTSVAAPPTQVRAVNAGPGAATVSWVSSSNDGGSTITDYTATASPGGASCTTAYDDCVISGLVAGRTYTFSVTSNNVDGAGAPSPATVPFEASNWEIVSLSGLMTSGPSGTPTTITGIVPTVNTCASSGNCVTGGAYFDANGASQAYAQTVSGGVLGDAFELPGSGALNSGATSTNDGAGIDATACSSAGNCVVGGWYTDSQGIQQVLVDQEINGTWSSAEELPGTAALNAGSTKSSDSAGVTTLGCQSDGTCFAGGTYVDAAGANLPFVDTFTNGSWGAATELPGISGLGGAVAPTSIGDPINSIACPASGSCVAGGSYIDSNGLQQAFTDSESGGVWQPVSQLTGSGQLNAGATNANVGAVVTSVSCPSSGECVAGGEYTDASGYLQGFVATETAGAWSSAAVPGLASLNVGATSSNNGAVVTNVSCPSIGNCVAAGQFTGSNGYDNVFVANESNGVWLTAELPAGSQVVDGTTNVDVSGLACTGVGDCDLVAVGDVSDLQIDVSYVAVEVAGSWGPFEQLTGSVTSGAPASSLSTSLTCTSDGACQIVGVAATDQQAGAFYAVIAGIPAAAAPVVPPNAPSDANITSVTNGAVTIGVYPGPLNGPPISSYTVTASPGGSSCTSSTPLCTITGLSPDVAYTFSATVTSASGTSSASPSTVAVYPVTESLGLHAFDEVARSGAKLSVVVTGVGANRKVNVSLGHGSKASCTTNAYGQCDVNLSISSYGALVLQMTSTSGKVLLKHNVVVADVIYTSKGTKGAIFTLTLKHGPANALVHVHLSDGRSEHAKASKAGAAKISFNLLATGPLVITLSAGSTTIPVSIEYNVT